MRRRAGERSLLQRLTAACADGVGDGPELLNNIGSTETSGAVSRGRLSPPSPLVGSPVAGAQAYLLDDGLRPVPVGVVGELYYAGDQLARGYWKRPGLTATRFIANPFGAEPGSRLYRSGDLARWTDDGRLEFAGRADHQVQVRGFRVELAEVEAALSAADGVAAAAARTWEVHDGTSLAGYVVPQRPITEEAEKAAFAASVRAALSTALPGYMVPSSLTVLDAIAQNRVGQAQSAGAAAAGGQHQRPHRTVAHRHRARTGDRVRRVAVDPRRRAIRRLLRTRRRQHPFGPIGLARTGCRSTGQTAHDLREPDVAAVGRRGGCDGTAAGHPTVKPASSR